MEASPTLAVPGAARGRPSVSAATPVPAPHRSFLGVVASCFRHTGWSGTRVLPVRRLWAGSGSARWLIGSLSCRARRGYAAERQPLPVLEMIATVVQSKPGPAGMYRVRLPDEVIQQYLAAARSIQGYLLLNVQPGRAPLLMRFRRSNGGCASRTSGRPWTRSGPSDRVRCPDGSTGR